MTLLTEKKTNSMDGRTDGQTDRRADGLTSRGTSTEGLRSGNVQDTCLDGINNFCYAV